MPPAHGWIAETTMGAPTYCNNGEHKSRLGKGEWACVRNCEICRIEGLERRLAAAETYIDARDVYDSSGPHRLPDFEALQRLRFEWQSLCDGQVAERAATALAQMDAARTRSK